MQLFAATTLSIQALISLRNFAFVALNCGAFGASIYFALTGRKPPLAWFLWAMLGSVILFGISLSHVKHQLLALTSASQSSSSTGATLESTVQESGNAMMKAGLVASGVYIVLRGWSLLALFSRKQVPNSALAIVRFFVGALLCVGILGIGLSAHRASVAAVPKSEAGIGNANKR